MGDHENDADMKIVGGEMPATPDTAARWALHKQCGNMDRAHRLGAVFAQQLLRIDDPDPAVRLQKQMLFAFAVDACCTVLLPDVLLAQTVVGTFFERLRTLLPAFEETLHRLGAFTFYRLCGNGGELSVDKVGAVYAALAGKAEDAAIEREGAALFGAYAARLEETVAKAEFQTV